MEIVASADDKLSVDTLRFLSHGFRNGSLVRRRAASLITHDQEAQRRGPRLLCPCDANSEQNCRNYSQTNDSRSLSLSYHSLPF
jgi:hypothetical protein